MALKALKIIEEEFAQAEQLVFAGLVGQGGLSRQALLELEQKIRERIAEECVEVSGVGAPCRFCGLPESDCHGGGLDSEVEAHDYAPYLGKPQS